MDTFTSDNLDDPVESLQARNDRQRDIDRRKDESKAGVVGFVVGFTVECDICRRELVDGQGYYQATLGMNEAPYFLNGPIENESAVESTTELTICSGCQPAVGVAFDTFLATLWALRAKDPETEGGEDEGDEDEPTVRTVVPEAGS